MDGELQINAVKEEAVQRDDLQSEDFQTNDLKQEEMQKEKYPIKDLIDNCEALGYKKEVVAGAFYHCEKTEMTKDEFKETIENFLKRKVG